MATLTTTNLVKILGAVFVVICFAFSATYADDSNTSKSTQTTKAKSAQIGGGGTDKYAN